MSQIINIEDIYGRYYSDNKTLLAIILTHSESVARKALLCAERRQLCVDRDFVYSAAMLHDIGVVKCHAPSLGAFGSKPYICHGLEGKAIMEMEGLPEIGRVCERHTGSGLTADDIIRQGLPLPAVDMLPETPEEKLICYADKFFSKSRNLTEEISPEKIMRQMEAHGKDSLERFLILHEMFS